MMRFPDVPIFLAQSQEWQEYSTGMNQECPRPFQIPVSLLINIGEKNDMKKSGLKNKSARKLKDS